MGQLLQAKCNLNKGLKSRIAKYNYVMNSDLSPGYEMLVNAIVLRCVVDYRNALRRKSEKTIQECERFLKSSEFYDLTGLNGSYLIGEIRKETDNVK